MKKSLMTDVHRIQLTTIAVFAVAIFCLAGVLVGSNTLSLYRERLLSMSTFAQLDMDERIVDCRTPEELREALVPCFSRVAYGLETGLTVGFYSRRFDRIIIAVSSTPNANVANAVLPPRDPGRTVWTTLKPAFTILWCPVRKKWMLKCYNPVVINGQVPGHTLATFPLSRLFVTELKLCCGILAVLLAAALCSAVLSRRVTREISDNLDRLLILDGSRSDVFSYPEFDRVAALNREACARLRLFASIVECSDDAIIALDREGRVLSWNKGAKEMYGYTREEMLGQSITCIVPVEDHPELEDFLRRLESGAITDMLERVRIRKNGDRIVVSIKRSLIWGENGQVIGGSSIHRDISERRKFETALAGERERLSVTMDSIDEGVIATDVGGRVTLMNHAAERITGVTRSEAIGMPVGRVLRLFDVETHKEIPAPVRQILDSGKGTVLDRVGHRRGDNEELYLSCSCSPVLSIDGNKIGTVFAFQDVTRKLQMEAELLRAEKLESLGVLAGGIAHDFNNILAAALSNIQLALTKSQRGLDFERNLRDTVEIVRKASNLTRQLLTFSKGGAPVRKASSLGELLIENAEFVLRGSKAKCRFDLPDDLWPVEIDEGQISQVIANLVINAKQAMPAGGAVTIRARNLEKAGADGSGRYVSVTVHDDGVGIPEEHLDKIFDPFFTTKKEGTGLGLSTSYSIIHQHNGRIEVESRPGAGTTFTLYLPAAAGDAGPKQAHKETRTQFEGARVLLMDDDESVLDAVGEMLLHAGYRVDLARDGNEAVEKYLMARETGHPFDVVVMDLTVPGGMGGHEAIAVLRRIDPAVKAIITSGYANDPIMAEHRRHGFCGVVTKPYRFDELTSVLESVLAQSSVPMDAFGT